MNKTNKYGFVSGGYIFDLLDRAALEKLNLCYPETETQQIYTKESTITYHKQLCDTTDIHCRMVYAIFDAITKEYRVGISLMQDKTKIAHARFIFVRADHNYCERKSDD
jgi:acyl-coenzyme A thioesterase PaaI-like protein